MPNNHSKVRLKVILASSSPRRKKLLGKLIKHFEKIETDSLEENFDFSNPIELVLFNATRKAESACRMIQYYPSIIIAADTVLKVDKKILGKPKSKEEAKNFLNLLSGRVHDVFTGVVVCVPNFNSQPLYFKFVEVTKVIFNELSQSSINNYVDNYLPLDKAGGYGIQELQEGFIKEIRGDYENVVGLPLRRLKKVLRKIQSFNPEIDLNDLFVDK